MEIQCFNKQNPPQKKEQEDIAQFLFTHLEEFGDPIEDIKKCMQYALAEEGNPGGFILTGKEEGQYVGAVIINETGMQGYIPENILVYIATHHEHRGKGIGGKLMKEAINTAQGNIALHVEPENPAKRLYEKLGFTSKYLEMRLKKDK